MLATGSITLYPLAESGRQVVNHRVDTARRILKGQAAPALPSLMGSIFSLCGVAQKWCATLALAQAAPQKYAHLLPDETALTLHLHGATAKDHLLRMCLDWPRLLHPLDESRRIFPSSLPAITAPFIADTDRLTWQTWWQEHFLGYCVVSWWQAWEEGGWSWLRTWVQQTTHLPTTGEFIVHLLREALSQDSAWVGIDQPHFQPWQAWNNTHPLTSTKTDASEAWLQQLWQHEQASLAPTWQQCHAHSGSWRRRWHDNAPHLAPQTLWEMLAWRLIEAIGLSTGLASWGLSLGCGTPREHQAVAWIEMSRGVLLHAVQLDEHDQRIKQVAVIAPTEWNFQPLGMAEKQLAQTAWHALSQTERSAHIALMVTALDPCVEHQCLWDTPPLMEDHHA